MDEQKTLQSPDLPQAHVTRRHWSGALIWLVPILAAIIAVYVVYERRSESGPSITVTFKDASGLKVKQTQVEYRGVPIGEVDELTLSPDRQSAIVKITLQSSAAEVAKDGSKFWIVRPQVGLTSITGLGTVITGPEIQMLPGNGAARFDFTGLDGPPGALEGGGLRIVLRTPKTSSLHVDTPLYYRGVEVGAVQKIDLSADAASADITVLIGSRYARLVRSSSKFWDTSGISASFGLFKGFHLNVDSLSSVVAGGLAFATPEDSGDHAVKDGTVFPLYAGAPAGSQQWRRVFPPEKTINGDGTVSDVPAAPVGNEVINTDRKSSERKHTQQAPPLRAHP